MKLSICRLSATKIHTATSLYKYLLRTCQLLPSKDIQDYYKHFVRQSYIQHSDEVDTDRVNEIISQAVKDANWVLKKYKIPEAEK